MFRVYGRCAVPVQRHERKRQRSRHHSNMHVPRLIRKAEVAERELDEVDNEEEKAFPEVGTAP